MFISTVIITKSVCITLITSSLNSSGFIMVVDWTYFFYTSTKVFFQMGCLLHFLIHLNQCGLLTLFHLTKWFLINEFTSQPNLGLLYIFPNQMVVFPFLFPHRVQDSQVDLINMLINHPPFKTVMVSLLLMNAKSDHFQSTCVLNHSMNQFLHLPSWLSDKLFLHILDMLELELRVLYRDEWWFWRCWFVVGLLQMGWFLSNAMYLVWLIVYIHTHIYIWTFLSF